MSIEAELGETCGLPPEGEYWDLIRAAEAKGWVSGGGYVESTDEISASFQLVDTVLYVPTTEETADSLTGPLDENDVIRIVSERVPKKYRIDPNQPYEPVVIFEGNLSDSFRLFISELVDLKTSPEIAS